jgi:hypothetical protein
LKQHTIHIATALALLASSAVHAQDAVQWKVADGGNGHWYQLRAGPYWWPEARALAQGIGGDLAALENSSERLWCRVRFAGNVLLGGFQQQPASHPNDNWVWVTGRTIDAPLGCDDSPCGCCPGETGDQDFIHFGGGLTDILGDVGVNPQQCADRMPALVEWSADCNSDGIVDYGQILQGQLADTNTDGIPDTCQCATNPSLPSCCVGDINGDHSVDGADIGLMLYNWGPCGSVCLADLNSDGSVNGGDIGLLLSGWGPCEG